MGGLDDFTKGKVGGEKRMAENVEQPREDDLIAENLLGISGEELAAFRERIAQVNGHLRVSVHPLYTERWRNVNKTSVESLGKDNTETNTFLREGFEKTLHSVVERSDSSPLLIFTDVDYVTETRRFIDEVFGAKDMHLARSGIVMCPTVPGHGNLPQEQASRAVEAGGSIAQNQTYDAFQPRLQEMDKILEQILEGKHVAEVMEQWRTVRDEHKAIRDALREREQTAFHALCSSLGIQSVLVSGVNFWEVKRDEEHTLEGCAGSIATAMEKEGIKVDISKFVWLPREVLKEKGFQTKQTGAAGVS